MSDKVTQARMEELQGLKRLKDELTADLAEMTATMQQIHDAMQRGHTADLVSARARAALARRGREVSGLSDRDLLDAMGMAVQRSQEWFEDVEEELRGLKELMGLSPAD